jgi:alkylhydroperoxidase family enzyme
VVAWLSGCEHELHQHLTLAREAGLSEEDLNAIETGDYDRHGPRLAAIARFTAATVRDLSPSNEVLTAVRGHVSDQVLVNIVLTTECYTGPARLIMVTGLELDTNRLEALPQGLPQTDEYRRKGRG